MLALIPKCPACLAAYVALGTGVGLSFGTAQFLRWLLLGGCLAAIGYFSVRTWREWSRRDLAAERARGGT